jgi:predicted amidohydrolase
MQTRVRGRTKMAKTKKTFTVACIQFNPKLNERDKNIKVLYDIVKESAKNGAKLIVTPEMATTGYFYRDREAIQPFVDTIPGITTQCFEKISKEYQTYIVIGMPEVDEETGIFYNSAALIGPNGYIGKYRKIHLWETEEHWAACGDIGIPVFQTELGKISINICMDSIYFESARLAALQGADILVFLTNSTGQSISTLQARAETNGLYIVSANRTNTENDYHMIGASAVWSPEGEKLAETDLIETKENTVDAPTILYCEIDPTKYDNPAKKRLTERRPELYKDLMLYKAPWDFTKTTISRNIRALIVQYEPVIANKEANLTKIKRMISDVALKSTEKSKLDLVVLPELTLTGTVENFKLDDVFALSDTLDSIWVRELLELAKEFNVHLVFGFIERQGKCLYNTAMIADSQGNTVGIYRKTHLHHSDKNWATPGNKIEVFHTELGKIGIMIGYDAAFPEVAGVLAVKRADIIVVPSSWRGEFGRELESSIAKKKYQPGLVSTWDAIAVGAQSYTIVSNFVGTEQKFLGKSGLYTLDPIYGLDYPVGASSDKEEVLVVNFSTIHNDWWFNQEKLIQSRKTFCYKRLVY